MKKTLSDILSRELVLSCQNNRRNLLKLLLKKGADPNMINNGYTGLTFACINNKIEVIQILLEYKADINLLDKYGQSPLMHACINQNIEIVKLLLENKADPNILNKNGQTVLFIACNNKNLEIIKLLLDYKADTNLIDNFGNILLINACMNKNIEIVKLLLEYNADPNIQDLDGNTPLIIACIKKNIQIIDLLLEKKVNLDIQNSEGDTALILTCKYNNYQIVKLLMNVCENILINKTGIDIRTEIIEILLKNNADTNLKDKEGFTALMCLCDDNNRTITESISENADFIQVSDIYYTNTISKVKLLLNNKYETCNENALMLACNKNNIKIIGVLYKYGCNMNIDIDKYSETVKDVFRKIELFKCLYKKDLPFDICNLIIKSSNSKR